MTHSSPEFRTEDACKKYLWDEGAVSAVVVCVLYEQDENSSVCGIRSKNPEQNERVFGRSEGGSIVLECRDQYITPLPDGTWRYQIEDLSSWTNIHGRDLMLEQAGASLTTRRSVKYISPQIRAVPASS
jgi:hypothetical protein